MITELSKEQQGEAVASIRRYAEANLSEPLGELAAGLLLRFFLEEIGPLVYNKAVSDAQARLTARLAELDAELYEKPFLYWTKNRRRGA